MLYYILPTNQDLFHHGVLGMKWGIRRYQNKDGSLTPRGRRRLGIGNNSGTSGYAYKATNTNSSGTSKRGNVFGDVSNLREVNKILKDTDNCSLCTFAFDLRNRGIDVRAGGSTKMNDGKTSAEIASWYKGNRQFTDNNNFWPYVTSKGNLGCDPKSAVKPMKEQILASQSNGCSGHMTFQNVVDVGIASQIGIPQLMGGHDAFYKIENGEIYIFDAQINEKMTLDEYVDTLRKDGMPVSLIPTGYLRTDDLTPNVEALTTSNNGQFIGFKEQTSRVAEKTQTPTLNYSPPTSKELRIKPSNYSPPYKSKSEMDLFKEDAEKLIKKASSTLYKTTMTAKKKAQEIGEGALKIADSIFWLLF